MLRDTPEAEVSSPYLLQHRDNPVDWYEWGDEALSRAASEDKPIFLSVGYAACHWCHVMAHESFEDDTTATILNEGFVSIKVDREERPDIDAIYMDAVQALTGRGGWPMSMFLTPEGVPFYGGTYFPRDGRGAMVSFSEVLEAVRFAWENRRADIDSQGADLLGAIAPKSSATASKIPDGTLESALDSIRSRWDVVNGGIGGAPKFPQPMVIEFMLAMAKRFSDGNRPDAAPIVELVEHTLAKMADGGLRDHLGGGFHRYCVDATWTVPHFEKMLYDNAQLASVYLHAYQVTGNGRWRDVVEDTLDYLVREMLQPAGGLSSSQDADSEGEEGKFFVWTPAEIEGVLGDDLGSRVCRYYGVTQRGNFENSGATVLNIADSNALAGAELAVARRRLFEARSRRIAPATDDKVVTSWNALALAAFSEAAATLGRKDYLEVARGIASHLRNDLTVGGALMHVSRAGNAQTPAFADDVAATAIGLLGLYETTGDENVYVRAAELIDNLVDRFSDPAGGFFTTADDAEKLVIRPKDLMDNAVPSANSLAAEATALLAAYTGESRYEEAAFATLSVVGPELAATGHGFGRALSTLAFLEGDPYELALVGDAAGVADLADVWARRYEPFSVLARGEGGASVVPLLADRAPVDGRAAAYLCRRFTCRRPVVDAEALVDELNGRDSAPTETTRG